MRLIRMLICIGVWVFCIYADFPTKRKEKFSMDAEYKLSSEAVLKELDTNANGLTSAQAKERQEKYGSNKLKEAEKATWMQRFVAQLKDPMLIILMIAAVVSAATTVVEFMRLPQPRDFGHLAEGLVEVSIIVVVVLLNAILGVIQESKA